MIKIDNSERSPIVLFKTYLYQYMKRNNHRYSRQREEVLKTLHKISTPITVEQLVDSINKTSYPSISYSTTARHVNFYNDVDWLIVINKVHKQYILVKDAFPITQ